MNSLEYLAANNPAWSYISTVDPEAIQTKCQPCGIDGAPTREYALKIELVAAKRIQVCEDPQHALLPACCVERHINPNSSFCLFLNSTAQIYDHDQANEWWGALRWFLARQDYASKRRLWPVDGGLCHGDAAEVQLAMESLTLPDGWLEEIRYSIFRHSGWLAGTLPRLTKDKSRVVNVREPCPRGCKRKHHPLQKKSCDVQLCIDGCHRQHKNILRAECPNRSIIERLVILEHERRRREKKFIQDLIATGVKCCNTMKYCPLRDSFSNG
ncbi:E2 domain-containing protein [uncultured Hyphomonas sp.]|jgi:hypothetical protein|uniref:E2 domain-containing protein n=1 Tax=uncultured Hyphomonas sp. TaxID=225298 RepID=UPI0030D9C7E7|tara:strand:- start:1391 stop:2200 length:810 start_codon:yes stop_codon:yes gene_type:complete